MSLVRLIRELTVRPGFWHRPTDGELRGDQPLPLIRLVRERPSGLLAALDVKLSTGQHGPVPHARVDAEASALVGQEPKPPLTKPVLPLLGRVVHELSADAFGRGQRLSFAHYGLVDFLTRLELSDDDQHTGTPVIGALKARKGPKRDRSRLLEAVSAIADLFVQGGITLMSFVARPLGDQLARNHVPGLRRQRIWLMRQDYAVPRHSTSFAGFAARLTAEKERSEKSLEQIKLLLVHAFLEDLRRLFRRRGRIFPRRPGWRRTVYVTLLLDNITRANGGVELLRLINEVRNWTGKLDPLLVVATISRAEMPADVHCPPAAEAPAALETWRSELPSKRHHLTSDARYLSLALPEANESDQDLAEHDRHVWKTPIVDFSPAPTAIWARRGVLPLAVAVVLLAGAIVEARNITQYRDAGCGGWAQLRNADQGIEVAALSIDGSLQCVGYSDGKDLMFGDDDRLRQAQERVFAFNETAKTINRNNPARPIHTIIYMAALTHAPGASNTDDATAEEITGLALFQGRRNNESATEPLLRVILVNGGEEMKAAPEVVRRFVKPLLDSDDSIKAVTGMERTVTETEQAIWLLGNSGVSTIATTLTGTGLAERSPLYFQLVPDNDRLAELVVEYAAGTGVRKITVYSPADPANDTYVKTLVAAMSKTANDKGKAVTVDSVGWGASPSTLGSFCAQGMDRSAELAFYAGREDDFDEFLTHTTVEGCYDPRLLPRIVAADAVHRFIADREQRGRVGTRVPVFYIGLAPMVVLAGPECLTNGTVLLGGPTMEVFCHAYRKVIDPSDAPSWPAELVGLSYDAAGLVMAAIAQAEKSQLHVGADRRPVHRSEVAQALREVEYHGVTGKYRFGADRIANRRNIAILTIADISDANATPTCAFLLGELPDEKQATDPRTHCPIPRPARPAAG